MEGSGADKAGIKEGDIIKEIDNIKISKFSDLTGHISAKRVNDLVDLKISRNGDIKSLSVKLTKNETRSEEHTSELQSRENLVCRLLLEKKNKKTVTSAA